MKVDSNERRGPGRPRRVNEPSSPIRGIVDKPDNPDNLIEFSYFDPTIFKHLFTLLKNLKVRDIYFVFNKEYFTILTRDHTKNRIFVKIRCEKALHYYCGKDNIYLSINRDTIQAVFINLNKSINKILITLEAGVEMLKIQLNDNVLSKTKIREIMVSDKIADEELLNIEDEIKENNTILSFSLTTRDFKETITDATSYGDKIKIEKHGDSPLCLTFSKTHTNICTEKYNDSDKIDLVSNVDDNESFLCVLHTMILKCISVSVINNKIGIQCFNNNKALLTSQLSHMNDLLVFSIFAEKLQS